MDSEIDLEVIFDLSYNIKTRIYCLERVYNNEGLNTIKHINILSIMYQMTGFKLLEEYLYKIATDSNLPTILKLESVKTLLEFQELPDDIEDTDDADDTYIKRELNKRKNEKNINRCKKAYMALWIIQHRVLNK